MFRIAKASGNPADRIKYNQKRNQVVCMLRNGKQLFFNQQLNNMWTQKRFGKLFGYLTKITPHVFQHWGTKSIESSLDKATTLNNYFYTCFNHRHPPLLDPPENLLLPDDCLSELLCTEESVFEQLSKLDTTKSTGIDGISSKML